MQNLKSYLRQLANFPQQGVVFEDINPLLSNADTFKKVIDTLSQQIAKMLPSVSKIVAIEARGFVVGGAIARKLEVGFVPVRKKGKLPPFESVRKIEYSLEYGSNILEMDFSLLNFEDNIVIFDDVLATGGTAEAVFKLLLEAKKEGFLQPNASINYAFLLEIEPLKGRQYLLKNTYIPDNQIFSLIQ
ncbi:MAG: adenine phosphoribosyltransferase [Bacteroidales bacterium]|jgi:adenine phosphoribosyltransferase|nr:adenine phosphoribosyltransferase [Bacteroidales bacterium]